MENNWFHLVVVALAAYRVARMMSYERGAFDCFLWVRQTIQALCDRLKDNGDTRWEWLHSGFNCPLCIGLWASCFFYFTPDWFVVPIAAAGLQVVLQKYDWVTKRINTHLDQQHEINKASLFS